MGRRPSKPNAIPHLRIRKQRSGKMFYYYDHGGKPRKEEPLGTDYGLAIKRWAEIEHATSEKLAEIITFRYVANKYRAEVIPTKASRTQRDNTLELTKLIEYFDDPPCPLEAITPLNVRQYMTWRSATSKSRANKEKALLSHIWNFARDKGYTALANPCSGINKFHIPGRDVYIEDDVYKAIYKMADQPLRDAMDLAYLTGQRPSDVLGMDERDIKEKMLEVQPRKTRSRTGTRIRIEVTGELAKTIKRIKERKKGYTVHSTRLIVNDDGQPITLRVLQNRFGEARAAAGYGKELQFRDLRAKAGTDKTESAGDIRQAQKLLTHSTVTMTETYIRNRRGESVKPTK